MKKLLSLAFLSLAIAVVACSQFGCAAQNDNTASANTSIAVAQATPDKVAIEAEITRIENDWPRIIKERDGATVRKVEADDIFVVYPDGLRGSKEQDAKDIESGALTADSWEISDLKINVLDNDVAIATLRTIVKNGRVKAPDGRTMDISGQYSSVDTFVRRNGQWQLVGSATVPIKNPGALAVTSPSPRAEPTKPAPPRRRTTPPAKTEPEVKPTPPPPMPTPTP